MKLSTVHKQRLSKIARVASAGALVVGSVATSLPAQSAQAAALTQNRLTINNSSVGANGVTYTLRFVPTSATPIGAVDVQFCTTANSFNVSCTAPTGFTTDEGVLNTATAQGFGNAGSGDSGTFSEIAENQVRYATGNTTDPESTGATDYHNLTFTTMFTNPTTPGGGTFFARIRTFEDALGATPIDDGTAVFATVPRVDVTGRVLEQMTFVVDPVNDAVQCGTGDTANVTSTAVTIPFGNFSSGTPKVGCHTISTATNASTGYSTVVRQVAQLGQASPIGAMCRQTAGNCVTAGAESGISAANAIVNAGGLADTVAAWTPGTTFGLGIAANGTQVGSGFTNPVHYRGFYDDSNLTAAVTVASSSGPTVAVETNVAYKADVPANQTAGLYQNQLMYITTPTF